ncbi:ribokinase [Flectobacillus roseus]|uniref:ribokinase n=1 Tax=Flectobacillus roseus TaxID=502259 RepID=UPI0024B6EEB8|nr:ribokinase [Flectobacillus roseus]MDI9869785.1 ribokinase [Flectobacillus roseus]
MKKIIVVGSSNTDMVIKAERLAAPGETIIGGKFLMNAGGKGANQAVASARLGCPTVFVCRVGDDIFGRQALQQFALEGINTDYVIVDAENPSGVALINVDAKGENCITVAPGANAYLSIEDIENAWSIFEQNDILLIQLETPIKTVEYTIQKAYESGVKVILNPAPAAQLSSSVFPFIHIITPNETEAELLTGVKVTDFASAQKAGQVFTELGVQNILITLGAKGVYLKSADFEGIVETPQVVAIDTTAAGDCFSGALAVAIHEEKRLVEAAKFACKAASIAVTRMGAQASMPSRAEM